jgi:hypothetical protein
MGMRWSSATRVAIAGLALGALGCSSQAVDQPAVAGGSGGDGSGVSGSGAGGSGTGGGAVDAEPPLGSNVALFDTDTEGFVFDSYHDPNSTNLADATSPSVPQPTLSFDTQGSPRSGS